MSVLPHRRLHCEILEDRRLLAIDALDALEFEADGAGIPSFAAEVQGLVWNDLNGNGQREEHEPGLAGVTVYSDLNGNGVLDNHEPRTESIFDPRDIFPNNTGRYELDNLAPGLHLIRQVVPEGMEQTYPSTAFPEIAPPFPIPLPPDAHVVLLHQGQSVSGFDFGNHEFETGGVTGLKWEDINGNGHRDDNEPGLPGVTVYADLNRDGRFQPGEPHAVTVGDNPNTPDIDETGRYRINGLRPGEHLIREVVPDGFQQTFPLANGVGDGIISDTHDPDFSTVNPESIHVQLAAGDVHHTSISITVHPNFIQAIHINAFAEIADAPFENLSGVQINGGGGDTSTFEIVLTGDGRSHDFDILLVDANPNIGPAVLIVYDRIHVTINGQGGGAHRVVIEPGEVVERVNFGNQRVRPGTVHGVKWNDLNGNGVRENNEPGLAGVAIYSDLNRNGVLDNNEPRTRTIEDDPVTDFDESGMYWMQLRAGRHVIREVVPEGFVQTFPHTEFLPPPDAVVDPILPPFPNGAHEVFVEPGRAVDGVDFGNQAIVAGAVEGLKWQDQDGDGVRDPNEPGLGNVVIYSDLNYNGVLDAGEPRTRTIDDPREFFPNDSGKYRLEGLRPGLHVIREVVPDGYHQTFPGDVVIADTDPAVAIFPPIGGAHFVHLASGQTVGELNFGNQPLEAGLIAGYKWVDLDGDRQRSNNEPGLAGVTIYADMNGNQVLDPDEPHAVTQEDNPDTEVDELGRYRLRLAPGTYTIREVVPAGYVQTFPPSLSLAPFPHDGEGWHTVVVAPGSVNDDVHFGNRPAEPGSVRGIKWNDLNGDGERDDNEPGLAGVVIYSDLNRNGRLDNNEPHTRTLEDDPNTQRNELGTYHLEGLRQTVHFIHEVLPPGYGQTFPRSPVADESGPWSFHGFHVIAISEPGQVVEGVDFGNQQLPQTIVAGQKWHDVDGDGVRDDNEPGLAGVVIFADYNRNGRVDADEPRTRTKDDDPTTARNETGHYMLMGLRPGPNLIREVVPDGFVQTFPVSDAASPLEHPAGHYVDLEIGDIVNGLDFGNHQLVPAGVSGRKWVDTNANGVWDDNELGLGGVTIYSDLNGNGVFDEGEPHAETLHDDEFTDFDEAGLYSLGELRPGLQLIREVVPIGSVQTYPSPLRRVNADAHTLFLEPGEHVDGIDFGNRPLDRLTMPRGDFNRDGRVDDHDREMWRSTYGSSTNLMADANNDGMVNTADYIAWRNNQGAMAANLSSVASTIETTATSTVVASLADAGDEPVKPSDAESVPPIARLQSASQRQSSSAVGAHASSEQPAELDAADELLAMLLTPSLGTNSNRDAVFDGYDDDESGDVVSPWLDDDANGIGAVATALEAWN